MSDPRNVAALPLRVHRERGMSTVILDRPHRRNAMNADLLRRLLEVLTDLEQDRDVGCVVLTGAQGTFSSGVDVKERAWSDPEARDERRELFRRLFTRLHTINTPIIAAVEGHALGGGLELAMACDLVVTAEDAQFGLPELALNAIPGGGAAHSLIQRGGRTLAARMLLGGERITGRRLYELGAVEYVVAHGEAESRAADLAAQLATGDHRVVAAAASLIRDSGHLGRTDALAREEGAWQLGAHRRAVDVKPTVSEER